MEHQATVDTLKLKFQSPVEAEYDITAICTADFEPYAADNLEFIIDEIEMITHTSKFRPDEPKTAFMAMAIFNVCVPEVEWESNDGSRMVKLPAHCRFRALFFAETPYNIMINHLDKFSAEAQAQMTKYPSREEIQNDPKIALDAAVKGLSQSKMEMELDGYTDIEPYFGGFPCASSEKAKPWFVEHMPEILDKILAHTKLYCAYELSDVTDKFKRK